MKIKSLVLGIMLILTGILFTGCGVENKIVADGLFEYMYIKEQDCYAIVGETEELPEEVAIPAYYKGKEVRYAWYPYQKNQLQFFPDYRGLHIEEVEKLYLPYTCDFTYRRDFCRFTDGDSFLPEIIFWGNNKKQFNYDALDMRTNRYNIIYFSAYIYEEQLKDTRDYYAYSIKQLEGEWKEEESGAFYHDYKINYKHIIKKANTSYLFNYEGAANDGYFFINSFECGGKIENTPYEPKREGYTFGGWYKEPECINAWNFDEDKLPEAKQDEEGNAEFVETKLYAKWVPAAKRRIGFD